MNAICKTEGESRSLSTFVGDELLHRQHLYIASVLVWATPLCNTAVTLMITGIGGKEVLVEEDLSLWDVCSSLNVPTAPHVTISTTGSLLD